MHVLQTVSPAAMTDLDPVELMLRVPIILLALTVHEFCHAYFALRMGDPTAYRLGRCTLNPLRHLEPLGTICLLFAPIGWAKPVPINPVNFRNWRQGVIVSTAAGPLSNLAQAVLFALLLRGVQYLLRGGLITSLSLPLPMETTLSFLHLLSAMLFIGVVINVGLAVFNCLPLYPLDGFHITLELLRTERQQRFAELAPAGPFVILGLVMLGNFSDVDPIGELIRPPIRFMLRHVAGMGV